MKTIPLVVAASLFLGTIMANARAQLDFQLDMSALNNPSLNANNMFVTFAANAAELTYGTGSSAQSLVFSGGAITIGGQQYGTSVAYSFQEIADNTLTIQSATSLIGFISYGSATGISQLGVGVQPNPQDATVPRYSNFEISYSGSGGGADLTNISQFGGSLRMDFLSGGTSQSYVANTLNTGDTFRALAAASGSAPSALITSGGDFVRAIGPNVFPASSAGTTLQNPYPKFNAYLQALNTTYGTSSAVVDLTNLATSQPPGGTGSVGTTSLSTADPARVTPSTSYNLDYHFNVIITQVAPISLDAPNGTYSVTLNGYVNATQSTNPSATYRYNGLSIGIAADDLSTNGNPYMTNFLYTESTVGQDIDVVFNGWSDLETDFGSSFVSAALQLKAAGDFAQGILTGFIGSETVVPGGQMLKDLTSYEWWQNGTLAYGPAQPNQPFYSLWGNVISEFSAGFNNGSAFDRGGVYGSPYDDRFALNLIAPDSQTDAFKITLLADGDLAVIPEPHVWALLMLTGAVWIGIRSRRLVRGRAA